MILYIPNDILHRFEAMLTYMQHISEPNENILGLVMALKDQVEEEKQKPSYQKWLKEHPDD